jgi:uncharacterized protein YcbK (DUF882 family)
MKPADWLQIKHFKATEFKEPDKMGYEFMLWLDALRGSVGVPMTITSSYRSPDYNLAVGGAPDSAHTDVPCNAVDIGMRPRPDDPNWNFTRFRIVQAAMDSGCRRIGSYANGSLHLDRSEGKRPAPRMWRVVGNEHSP